MKIDKEKFIRDIEKDLGVKKYEPIEYNESCADNLFKDIHLENLEDFFKDFYDILSQEYKAGALDIEKTCKITKEEVKNGCEKEIKIKREFFDKIENKIKNKKVKIKVKIPKEIKEGHALIVYGEGNEDENLNRGNLLVKIDVKNS